MVDENPFAPPREAALPAPIKKPIGTWRSAKRGAAIGAAVLGVPTWGVVIAGFAICLFGGLRPFPWDIALAALNCALFGGTVGAVLGAILGWDRWTRWKRLRPDP